MMAKNNPQKKEINTDIIPDFITKISIQFFSIEKKLNDIISSNPDEKLIKELKEIQSHLIKNDKEILDFFNIKLSYKEKEKIFNILNLMK